MNAVTDERIEQVNALLGLKDKKLEFHEATAKMYPSVPYPEICWLFDQVLGIDPRLVSADPFTKKEFKSFILEDDNTRIKNPTTGKAIKVTRKFTPTQQKALREWWPLLPEEMIY